MEPAREVFIFITPFLKILFYLAALLSVLIFLAGVYFKFRLWFKAPAEEETLEDKRRLILRSLLYLFSKECLFARRVFERSILRGWMLVFVYWGFMILSAGTLIVALDHYMNLGLLEGNAYLLFSLVMDIAGGALFTGILFFTGRRIFLKKELVSDWHDISVLLLLLLIVLTGFSLEGIRLLITEPFLSDLSPVGDFFSLIFGKLNAHKGLYSVFWLLHVFSALVLIAYIPFSKQFHMFAAQITTMLAKRREEKLKELVHG